MDDRMETVVAGVALKNPVITASGTFGSGREYGELIDLNCLGAVTVKGVSCEPWKGNPIPRIAETQSGMLNSIGLQNPGVEHFIEHDLPFLRQHDTKIIVNICGHTLAQYCAVAERLADCDVDMLELNISCPNVEEGGGAGLRNRPPCGRACGSGGAPLCRAAPGREALAGGGGYNGDCQGSGIRRCGRPFPD